MRKHGRGQKISPKMVVVLGCFLFVFMCVGYAAFQTRISLNAKGTFVKKDNSFSPSELNVMALSEGDDTVDGIYNDSDDAGRVIFKGSNPDNYVLFNCTDESDNSTCELWRILSIEDDGSVKIIRNDAISNVVFDDTTNRNVSTSTYCVNALTSGCNAWAATSNLIGTPSTFSVYSPSGNSSIDSNNFSGTVAVDASINKYLNTEYYNSLNSGKNLVINRDFYVGASGNNTDVEDFSKNNNQEKQFIWNGKVGLLSVNEYLKTSTNSLCMSLSVGSENNSSCGSNNWLKPSSSMFTLSPVSDSTRSLVWGIDSTGAISGVNANVSLSVKPVLYLSSTIKLDGKGTSSEPYVIISE